MSNGIIITCGHCNVSIASGTGFVYCSPMCITKKRKALVLKKPVITRAQLARRSAFSYPTPLPIPYPYYVSPMAIQHMNKRRV